MFCRARAQPPQQQSILPPPRVSPPPIDIHESDTAQVSIPVVVQIGGYYSSDSVSDLTSTGTPLGEGQQINIPSSFESAGEVLLDFTLTNGQYISLSEVGVILLMVVSCATSSLLRDEAGRPSATSGKDKLAILANEKRITFGRKWVQHMWV